MTTSQGVYTETAADYERSKEREAEREKEREERENLKKAQDGSLYNIDFRIDSSEEIISEEEEEEGEKRLEIDEDGPIHETIDKDPKDLPLRATYTSSSSQRIELRGDEIQKFLLDLKQMQQKKVLKEISEKKREDLYQHWMNNMLNNPEHWKQFANSVMKEIQEFVKGIPEEKLLELFDEYHKVPRNPQCQYLVLQKATFSLNKKEESVAYKPSIPEPTPKGDLPI